MELTVMERLLLLGILPAEGDITTLRLIRSLRENLSFNEAEHEALHIEADGMRVQWDGVAAAAAGPKEVEIGKKATDVIATALKRMSAAGSLGMQCIDLYGRFVPNED